MADTTTASTHTVLCTSGRHGICYGYVAPLVYGGTRPCRCSCHEVEPGDDYNRRDFAKAAARARASYYRGMVPPDWVYAPELR